VSREALWPGWVFAAIGLLALASIVVTLVIGCASSASDWQPLDTADSLREWRSQAILREVCESDAGCTAAMVRVVERSTSCLEAARLHRHAVVVTDGGPTCQP